LARKPLPTTSSNRRAAVRDAKRLLAGVVPPVGAVLRSSGNAIGLHAHLLTEATASAVAYSKWIVQSVPTSVLSFVEGHLPAGSTLLSAGSSGPRPSTQSVIRAWPAIEDRLDVRWLEIDVTARSEGGTVLRAESQSEWVIVRPLAERIPAGVREVDVTRGWPGKSPMFVRRVTGRANVHALVDLFDSLGIAQPGTISCPGEELAPSVIVEFRGGGTGRLLARASVSAAANAAWPDNVPGWACYPVAFQALGHTWPPLVGGVIRPIQRLLHVKLG
jgi:hypothetical protein